MRESSSSSKLMTVVGLGLLALGIAVFAVRLLHEGAYAVPRGGNLFGGLGALLLGGVLVWSAVPRGLGWLALAASPVALFFGLYATMAELEEVVSLYATDSAGQPAELRRPPWGSSLTRGGEGRLPRCRSLLSRQSTWSGSWTVKTARGWGWRARRRSSTPWMARASSCSEAGRPAAWSRPFTRTAQP